MATTTTPDEIKSEVFEWLKETRYASTSLEPLSGGLANFTYRAHLSEPLEDGTTDVIVKHGEGYMAAHPANKLTTDRCRIEYECLKELALFYVTPDPVKAVKYDVRTPLCYLYDDATNTQIQEYLPNGINLKAYALKNFPSPTPESLQPQCHQLGKALARWITAFHHKTEKEVKDWVLKGGEEPEPKLYTELKSNTEMQALKHYINYDWLLQRIDKFPDILEEVREIFVKVKEVAANELKGTPEELGLIHGDFWTGNILLPDAPIQAGVEIPIFVVDWENAQLGVKSLDHGEMLGEMYELWLYKKIDAGLWMVQGYVEGLGEQTESSAWRLAIQLGCHLLAFGTVAPGWGTPDQAEDVARLGRDIIVNAWQRNREWFEKSELVCLFPQDPCDEDDW